jgi:hypothetical protein
MGYVVSGEGGGDRGRHLLALGFGLPFESTKNRSIPMHTFRNSFFLSGRLRPVKGGQTSDHKKVIAGGSNTVIVRLRQHWELSLFSQVLFGGSGSSLGFFLLSSPGIDIPIHIKLSH